MTTYPVGSIIQNQKTIKTDTQSVAITAGTVAALGPTVTITPKKLGSKIRVKANFSLSASGEMFPYAILYRDGVALYGALGDAAGSRTRVTSLASYIPSANRPSTMTLEFDDVPNDLSAHTYEVRFTSINTFTLRLNMLDTDTNSNIYPRAQSFISAEEIA